MSYQDYARRLIAQIAGGICSGQIQGLGFEERKFLLEVAARVDAGHQDPLGITPPRGRPKLTDKHLAIAREVARLYWDQELTLEEACNQVAENFHISGAYGGTAEKAFRKHQGELKIARLIYTARSEGRSLSNSEKAELKDQLEKAFQPSQRGHGEK